MTLAATVEWGMCARSETNGCPVAVVIRVVVVCVVARCVGGNFAEAPERANHCSTFEETGLITLHVRERARNRKWDTRQFGLYLWAHIKDWHVPRRFEYRKRVTTGVVEYTAATFA